MPIDKYGRANNMRSNLGVPPKAIKRTLVFCTCSVIGYHFWLQASEKDEFLRNLHRHVFHCKVTVSVSHDNRQEEILELKQYVTAALSFGCSGDDGHDKKLPDEKLSVFGGCLIYDGFNFGNQSCEMLATRVGEQLFASGYDVVSVEVSEDNENGAIVEYVD